MTDINQEEIGAKLTKMAEDFRDSLDNQFNPNLRIYLANIISGRSESRDFKLNPLSDNELNAIANINADKTAQPNDYYVEQIQEFIAHIHEDRQVDVSNLMQRVLENVRSGSLANNEKAKKSFQYFREFIENI